mgnify:CR=1 FL=1
MGLDRTHLQHFYIRMLAFVKFFIFFIMVIILLDISFLLLLLFNRSHAKGGRRGADRPLLLLGQTLSLT